MTSRPPVEPWAYVATFCGLPLVALALAIGVIWLAGLAVYWSLTP